MGNKVPPEFQRFKPQTPMIAFDRFRKVIEPGHLVMFNSPEDLVFEVVSVKPVLNPAMQAAGVQAMEMTIAARFPVQFAAGQVNRGIVIVGETQERIQAKAGSNGQAEQPGGTGERIIDAPADEEPPATPPTEE